MLYVILVCTMLSDGRLLCIAWSMGRINGLTILDGVLGYGLNGMMQARKKRFMPQCLKLPLCRV